MSRLRWTRPSRVVQRDPDALPPIGSRADRIRHAAESEVPGRTPWRPRPQHVRVSVEPTLARRQLEQLRRVVAFVDTTAFVRKTITQQEPLLDEIETAYRALHQAPSIEYSPTHPALESAHRLLVAFGRKPSRPP